MLLPIPTELYQRCLLNSLSLEAEEERDGHSDDFTRPKAFKHKILEKLQSHTLTLETWVKINKMWNRPFEH